MPMLPGGGAAGACCALGEITGLQYFFAQSKPVQHKARLVAEVCTLRKELCAA